VCLTYNVRFYRRLKDMHIRNRYRASNVKNRQRLPIAIPIPMPIVLVQPHRAAHIIKHPTLPGDTITSTGNGKRIGSEVDIETDCDPDTDPDNAVRAALSRSHNQASGSAGGPMTFTASCYAA
jgi:hypothetical protein